MAKDWAFPEGPDTQVRATKRIMAGGPILTVNHKKGEWLFVDAGGEKDAVSVTLGEFVERFPWVADEFADLPAGGSASRDHVMAPWHRG